MIDSGSVTTSESLALCFFSSMLFILRLRHYLLILADWYHHVVFLLLIFGTWFRIVACPMRKHSQVNIAPKSRPVHLHAPKEGEAVVTGKTVVHH